MISFGGPIARSGDGWRSIVVTKLAALKYAMYTVPYDRSEPIANVANGAKLTKRSVVMHSTRYLVELYYCYSVY